MMTNIRCNRLFEVQTQISAAEQRFGRPTQSVKLIAVSKSQPISAIQAVIDRGQLAFGENYVQEAVEKIKQLKNEELIWHFLGKIQSNKAKLIAENFQWVHSLCELKTATLLNQYRKANLPPLNVCIQINLDQEPNKSGIDLQDLVPLAQAIEKLAHLNLRGLIAIPKAKTDFSAQRDSFKKLRLAFVGLQELGFNLDTLSMGMSDDFVAAIAEGATLVRIGTAIFGNRGTIKIP